MANWQEIINGRWGMCFGCGQHNPIGLKLNFTWDGKTARAEFTPQEVHQGWPSVVMGGIIATMLDEGAGWATLFNGLNTVTARMEILFRNPAPVGVPLIVTGTLTRVNGKRVEAATQVMMKDGTVIAEGTSLHVVIKNGTANAGQ